MPADNKAQRVAHLRWVPIAEMKISPRAQREFRQSHADKFAADFDLEALGYPVVNYRDGSYYVVDGQHRIAALKLIGWGDQKIQCECYDGLSEAEEADLFLRRDNRKAIASFEKFRIALTAERATETDINRIVLANGLTVSKNHADGSIRCVGTLRKSYQQAGGPTLGRALRIIRDAYGSPGLEAPVIEGITLLCQRYNGALNDENAVARLANVHGGVNGLLGRAQNLRKQTGNQRAQCVAAAAVEIINAGRGGKKLPDWWREA